MKMELRVIRRLAGALLLIFLLFSAAVFVTAEPASHNHADGYTALAADASEIAASGKYYLAEDITLANGLTVTGQDVSVELCLNGYLLQSGGTTSAVIRVAGGASLTVCDCYDPTTHVGVEFDHTFQDPTDTVYYTEMTLSGGVIGASKMSGIRVAGGSTLTLEGGAIAGCSPSGDGGGVYLQKGTVNIQDGAVIRNNLAGANGGGVYAANGSASAYNSVNLSGGQIVSNSADSGGGVYLKTYAELNMSSGQISGNIQTSTASGDNYGGGGVYMSVYSALNMSGGQISGNTADGKYGGVMLRTLAEVRLSGDAVIDGNTSKGVSSNLCVLEASQNQGTVSLTGPLSGSAAIGLTYTTAQLSENTPLITADSAYNGGVVSAADFACFSSDDDTRSLMYSQTGGISVCSGRAHYVCGEICAHGENGEAIHTQVVFQPMPTGFTGGALAAGNYYLEEDVILIDPIQISGNVSLCLNGYEIRNSTGRVLVIESGGVVDLHDCNAEGLTHSYRNPYTKVEVTVDGGLLSGYYYVNAQSGGVSVVGGTLNLYSGTIGGASVAGGVSVTEGGVFHMAGGAVNDCYTTGSGGGVYADSRSSFVMTGGEIRRNHAGLLGGGVYAESGVSLSGEVYLTDSTAQTGTSNVHLPQGTFVTVTGDLSGTVGVSTETPGVFTKGGAAAWVRSFDADAAGHYAETENGECTLANYAIEEQPTPETLTVLVKCPEEVASYQWYAAAEAVLSEASVTPAGCTYNAGTGLWSGAFVGGSLDCFTVDLKEGDTVRVTLQEGTTLDSMALIVERSTRNGTVQETAAFVGEPGTDGVWYISAPEDGSYTLRVSSAESSSFSASVSVFQLGQPAAYQTGATFTGGIGCYICRIEYADGETVLYSEPLYVEEYHGHAVCGEAACTHEPAHNTVEFTPLAATLTGELLVGPELKNDFALESGSYYLPADTALSGSLTIPSGTSVSLCLNGKGLSCGAESGVTVETGATLTICDCATGTAGSIAGQSAGNGGGIWTAGTVTLYGGTVSGSAATGNGGGVYVADGGRLILSGSARISGGTPADIYLEAGRLVELETALPEGVSMGVAMETPGVFTKGAAGAALERFYSAQQGTFLQENSDGELEMQAYAILVQPTTSAPSVTVNNETGASYQWYTAEYSPVEDENDSRYDAETGHWTADENGECFTVTLEAGQTLIVRPQEALPDGASVTLNGVAMKVQEDGSCALTVTEDGSYTLTASASAVLTAEVYTADSPLTGETGKQIRVSEGAYYCRITWPDGTQLQTELLLFPESGGGTPDQPDPPNPPGTPTTPTGPTEITVKFEYHKAYVTGYSDGSFDPDGVMTRAEAASLLARQSDDFDENGVYDVSMFSDVDPGSWYAGYIGFCAENGIITGYSDGSYKPTASITRGEFAATLARVTGLETKGTGKKFADCEGHWAEEYILSLAEAGAIEGYADGKFRPDQPITRAEAVKIIVICTNRVPDPNKFPEAYANTFSDVEKDAWYYSYVLEAAIGHYKKDLH